MSSIQAKMAARVSALGDKVDEAMAKASSNLGDARDQLGLGSSSRSKSTVSDLFPDEKPVRSTVNDLFPDEKPVKAVPAPLPPLAVPTPTPLRSPAATAPPVATTSWQQATPFESRPPIAEAPPDAPTVAAGPPDTRWDPPDPTILLAGELVQGRPLEATRYYGLAGPEGGGMKPPPGLVYVTNHRLLWAATKPAAAAPTASVRLLAIDRVRSQRDERVGDRLLVDVYQKYDALPSLRMTMADAEAHQMASYIKQHQAARTSLEASFAVAHGVALGAARRLRCDGWRLYSDADEFQRMGLNNPLSHWRVCRLNEQFALCGTYPRLVVVPRKMSDDEIRRAADFRSGQRLPALCWKDPTGVASITRCSQPMVGVSKARSAEDEALLQAIADTNPFADRLQIIDCRPRLNAELNAAKGKGYEHSSQYANIKLSFMDIANIHVMRASLKSFLQLLATRPRDSQDDDFFADVHKCGWLDHIRALLRTSARVAALVHVERSSVLVHCSDGWDRTPQVTALAQLLLDPHFRTLRGFGVLVAKEWLSFGHQFALRTGTIAPNDSRDHHSPGDEQLSPVFVQFVECVWQLAQQFPTAFEFNGTYLAALLDVSLCGSCGTFLGNSERQRAAAALEQRCGSVWDDLDIPAHRNLEWRGVAEEVLLPDCAACQLRLWTAYYCRGGALLRAEPATLLEARCTALVAERDAARTEIAQLRAQLAAMPAAALPAAADATDPDAAAVPAVPAVPAAPAAPAAPAVPLEQQHEFLDAAKKGDFAAVRAQLEAEPLLLNVQPADRWSALHQFAQAGKAEAVAFLLSKGASREATTIDGKTPLGVTNDDEHDECAAAVRKLLLGGSPERGAAPPPSDAAAEPPAAAAPASDGTDPGTVAQTDGAKVVEGVGETTALPID